MARKKVTGQCRVCGVIGLLTKEHIIPKAAGGGRAIKLYKGDELFKTLYEKGETPYGEIIQEGYVEYSLCRDCNSYSGLHYDEEFARFFNSFRKPSLAPALGVAVDELTPDFLEGNSVCIDLYDLKPHNVAKRILMSFCSVAHPGFLEGMPEIRNAVRDKNYKPNTDKFSIYLSLLTGVKGAALSFGIMSLGGKSKNGGFTSTTLAGVETQMLAFYLTKHDEHKNGGFLSECLDITNWLTDYGYNEIVSMRLELLFKKPIGAAFAVPSPPTYI